MSAKAAPFWSKNGFRYIKISMIAANPMQPRTSFDETALAELSQSIKAYGVLNPLTVRKSASGFELIAGERRLRAAKLAGLSDVPCIIIQADERESSFIALVENLQRRDLDFFEEARGYERLIRVYGLTQEGAAKRVGKTQSAVANKLRLLKLSPSCTMIIRERGMTERHARALLRIDDERMRIEALNHIMMHGLNVMQTDAYIDELLAAPSHEPNSAVNQEKKNERTKRFTFTMIKDVRFFLNTINRAMKVMQKAGVQTECEREEKGDDIILKIKISSAKS